MLKEKGESEKKRKISLWGGGDEIFNLGINVDLDIDI